MGKEGESIRRRRECLKCEGRFTTYERVEEVFPLVIKKDGRREPYDRLKILNGLKKACEKRPVSVEALEKTVADIEKSLQDKGLKEIPSTVIGEEVKVGEKAPHFGFGGGIHYCLGHYVARADMATALTVLAGMLADPRPAGEAAWLPDSGNTGPVRLPIAFTSRPPTVSPR